MRADRGPDGRGRAPHAGHAGVRAAVVRRAGRAAVPVRAALGGPHLARWAWVACWGPRRGSPGAGGSGGIAVGIVACGVVLAVSDRWRWWSASRSLLTLLVVAVSIPVMRRLHDAVPSTIRAGVASGVGTLTWLAFVPFAIVFGAVSESAGLDRAAVLFVAVAWRLPCSCSSCCRKVPRGCEERRSPPPPATPSSRRSRRSVPAARRSRLARPLGTPPTEWSHAGARRQRRGAGAGARRRSPTCPPSSARSSSSATSRGGPRSEVRRASERQPRGGASMLHRARGHGPRHLERYVEGSERDVSDRRPKTTCAASSSSSSSPRISMGRCTGSSAIGSTRISRDAPVVARRSTSSRP